MIAWSDPVTPRYPLPVTVTRVTVTRVTVTRPLPGSVTRPLPAVTRTRYPFPVTRPRYRSLPLPRYRPRYRTVTAIRLEHMLKLDYGIDLTPL